ncbi:hypothetical protein N7448_002377 [Penicillium atrosanguineum]|uniref:Trichothecene 3-O-acetyltransferase n=1 Tax=Penicillium atrosanguineum TaxID=1132637 RepID=A0A9W9LAI3_9EURO|nr:hypothetical protein N7526_006826 [Penicillium atrosanguineum]KAJ5144985.1 hypothetical protein N7448_002377 [Penicillium atrosanguineum]KAJ5311419.1 hypothetical protein N7476_007279 [Penicillium atrosanguineum]
MSDTVKTAAIVPTSSVAVIKPHPDSHGQVVKLSAIDQIAPRDYMSICLFFRLGPDADKRQIFSVLQETLLRIVSDMPELACCVQKHTNNNREEVELVFDSSKGVEIHYKDYTSPELCGLWNFGTFDQLEQEHFPLNKMPRHIVFGTSAKLEDNVKLPSLIVQLNFIPGGLILGSCLHHVAGDGQCNFMLYSTIGAHFSAVADGLDSKPTSKIHLLERSGVVEGDQSVTLEEFPHWKLAEDTTEFLNPTVYRASEIPTFEYATYFISAEKLALLKSRISNNVPETKLGTVETLGAFIWRHIIVARNINPRRYPEAKLSITIDARGRTKNPNVPSNYWGNFAEPNAVARLPVASLQGASSSTKHLTSTIYPEAARRIKKAIAAVDDKAVRRLVGLLNQMPKSTTLTWNVNRYPGPDMLLVCIQGHAYNDIYFGHELGCPSALRCTVGDTEGKPDGRCLILPPRRGDGKGLEVALQYDNSTLKRLENNIEFGEFFVRRN